MLSNTQRNRLTIPAIFCLLCLMAGDLSAQREPLVYEFLRVDQSARAAAMAGAFVTVPEDANGIRYNPALLSTIGEKSHVSVSGFKHVLDINSGSLAGATRLDGVGSIGGAISFNSYGSFTRTDRNGNAVGEFGSSDIVLTLGWADSLGEGFSAGVGGEVVFSTIESYSSTALALNGGVYWADTTANVQAGLAILHLGTQVSSFGDQTEDLPLDLTFGVSHQLRGLPLLLAVNFSQLLDETDTFLDHFSSFSIGGEFRFGDPVRFRLGYDNRIRQDVSFGGSKGLSGLSTGIGILFDQYRFDYGFSSLGGLGAQHRVTLNADL